MYIKCKFVIKNVLIFYEKISRLREAVTTATVARALIRICIGTPATHR